MTDRPRLKGLRGPSPHDRRLALSATPARMPDDYQPRERSHPNRQYVRHWRDQPGNSCVGHGTCQTYEVGTVRHGGSALEPLARLHAYSLGLEQQTPFGERLKDEGTYVDRVLAAMKRPGVCLERDFPPTLGNIARRPGMKAELHGFQQARGDFWQLNPDPGERLWREVCWAIDTFGAVCVGKLVGPTYERHDGEGVLRAPDDDESAVGGHCTVYIEYRNFGTDLLELGSWIGWGFKQGVIGSDGNTRTIDSLGWVSKQWLYSRFHMVAYAWVP